MLLIPGVVISLLTFPGVVVHEWAHAYFCRRYGLPVHEVVYFRLGNPAGYVLHGEPQSFRASFAISGAPFLINSVLAVVLMLPFPFLQAQAAPQGKYSVAGMASLGLVWLSLSVGMHAIPSSGDANAVWTRMKTDWREHKLVLLAAPLVWLVYLLDLLRYLWADAIYAIILAGVGLGIGAGLG